MTKRFDEKYPLKIEEITNYVFKRCELYNIDSSHGLEHAQRVAELARKFGENDCLPHDEIYVIIASSLLHDSIDKKYMNEEEGALEVYSWLREKSLDKDTADIIIKIITNMSYSVCLEKKQNGLNPYPSDLGKYITAYHIVRHADLIDAYDPQRCYDYVKSKLSHIYTTEVSQQQQVRDTFDFRIFRYICDGWIFRSDALKISQKRHIDALLWFRINFVNRLD